MGEQAQSGRRMAGMQEQVLPGGRVAGAVEQIKAAYAWVERHREEFC